MGAPAISDEKILAALKASRGLVHIAARNLGCAPSSIYRRVEKCEKVREALANEREFTTDVAESSLFRAITNGEAWAVCFYLKTQGKQRGYVERQEWTGANGGPIAIIEASAPADATIFGRGEWESAAAELPSGAMGSLAE